MEKRQSARIVRSVTETLADTVGAAVIEVLLWSDDPAEGPSPEERDFEMSGFSFRNQ